MPINHTPITGWGLYPVVDAEFTKAHYHEDLVAFARQAEPLLGQGNCRSYGDACLAPRVVSTMPLNHLLAFDTETGILRAEAGVTLEEIIRFALPRGWFLPVTPGTKFPTLGGCIAADVHGKNHHVDGSIGCFIESIEMVLADGTSLRCSPQQHPDLFHATLGGMGLTGFIYAVTMRLKPVSSAYISMRSIKTSNFTEACHLFEETKDEYIYSVAWIDCLAKGAHLGRSIVMLGNHAPAEQLRRNDVKKLHSSKQKTVPFFFPKLVLNRLSMKTFNTLYYNRQLRRQVDSIVHYDPFFYPLDMVSHWNRIYGRSGFLQYQFVIPFTNGLETMQEILERISAQGSASFLAVLKTFGPQQGLLSFPMSGYTLALDFPLHDERLIPFLRELNKVVLKAGGRIYLAKDAILEQADFEAMYPQLDEFKRIKKQYDPEHHFRSCQSDRLGIT
jgi:FAD/FMN-containing dehydrogenase